MAAFEAVSPRAILGLRPPLHGAQAVFTSQRGKHGGMFHPATGLSICTFAVVKPVPLMEPLLVVLKIAAPASLAVFLEKVLLELMAPCQPGRETVSRQATSSAFDGRDAESTIGCPELVKCSVSFRSAGGGPNTGSQASKIKTFTSSSQPPCGDEDQTWGQGWCLAAHLYMGVVDCTAVRGCRVADKVTRADVAGGRPPEDCSPIR